MEADEKMNNLRKLFDGVKKLSKKNEYYFAKMRYIKYLKKEKINDHIILLESQHGTQYNGNIYYLLRELSKDTYKEYDLYLSITASKESKARTFLDEHKMSNVHLTVLSSDEYFKILASAKYLINDNTFLPFFMKKYGQVYMNTWHGTPLKTLGNKSETYANTIGNTQRNFCMADYLLAPNRYTAEHLCNDYMLQNIAAKTKIILSGYPRNEAFFDDDSRKQIRIECGLQDKEVFAYMPTWRGYGGNEDKRVQAYLIYHLSEIDKRLTDGQVMFVNLHPVSRRSINFSMFSHIKDFPEEYETYEFLNACDCLITDYSSVMFDFALSNRKCILFAYDFDQYKEIRGFYIDLKGIGFPVAETVTELFEYINDESECDYRHIREKYCEYDAPDASKKLCSLLLREGTFSEENIIPVPDNGKKNILIYSGDLSRNGITSSLCSLMKCVDKEKYNFIITLKQKFPKENLKTLQEFCDNGTPYILILGKMNLSFLQKVVHYLYGLGFLPFSIYQAAMGDAYKYETERLYGEMRIDVAIHFSGYEYKRIEQFGSFDCPRVIFVHSNMVEEIRRRKNQKRSVLKWAYNTYDKVALVSDDMYQPTKEISKSDSNFCVVQNTFDFESVVRKSKLELSFDDFTKCNISFDDFKQLIDSDKQKIISSGRFSPEKGHKRLIDAFEEIADQYPDVCLIIIGGRSFGNGDWTFTNLSAYVSHSKYSDRIVLIENMSNPYSVIARCNGFILPSYHEGLGLVLLEADALGLPVVATDIPGPRGFMKEHGGKLVENTAEGVREGIEFLLSSNNKLLDIDYREYNNKAVAAFESILDL